MKVGFDKTSDNLTISYNDTILFYSTPNDQINEMI